MLGRCMLQVRQVSNAVENPSINLEYSDNEYDAIQAHGIEYLYHMTHIKNLPSILEKGLLSHNQAHKQCTLVDISNQAVNAKRANKYPVDGISLHSYVPCYFAAKNPMSSKLRNYANEMVILKINPEILYLKGMIFSDGNAASCQTKFYKKLKKLNKLNWACLQGYWKGFEDGSRLRCAEVLIPERIGTEYIEQIAVNSRESYFDVLQLTATDIDVVRNAALFF
jgi:hypothetical protein